MEDLEKRALHTFLFLSGSSLFCESAMRLNGSNYPQNPAWGLIHPIFEFFAGIWIIVLVLWAIYIIFNYIHQIDCARNEKARLATEQEKYLERRQQDEAERERTEKLKAQAETQRQKKMQTDHIERLRIEKERLEIRSRRSPADAINAAFAEFLKGG